MQKRKKVMGSNYNEHSSVNMGVDDDDHFEWPSFDYDYFYENPRRFSAIRKATLKKIKKYKLYEEDAILYIKVHVKQAARKFNHWLVFHDIPIKDPSLIEVERPEEITARQRTRSLDNNGRSADGSCGRQFCKKPSCIRAS
ncbi:hypothetical protein HELRODRAFT_191332 [Helobdella robusta]|uniref:Uncharacterized protein n=1 Tax=Helobdella robusta TaxID=6412 RepID=T1FSW4_HELRO|nr:hypothetical protein HELRODRAFT_191332 [Helobdella robusta]ESO05569.1 hypothetical protein HELRODRAFT_191332 [Helobdella robusta]